MEFASKCIMSSTDEDASNDDCANQNMISSNSDQNQCMEGQQECTTVYLNVSESVELTDTVNEVMNEVTNPKESAVSSQLNPETESISHQQSPESSSSSFNLHRYQSEFDYRRLKNGVWSNNWQSFFPCLSCCIGVHAMCRIAVMTVLYGGAFVFQFAFLSMLVGVPFLIFMVLIGQRVGSGLIQMWFISPGLKGIGIALQVSYVIFLSFNISPAAWIVPFFKDSLISHNETFNWSNRTSCREPGHLSKLNLNDVSKDLEVYYDNEVANAEIEFQQIGLLFSRCTPHILIWGAMILVAVKGIKVASLGVAITYGVGSILFIITTNRITNIPHKGFTSSINIDWANFKTVSIWIQSTREVFFTWMMLGGIILHACSHNKTTFNLKRYFFIFLIWTATMLYCAISWGASLRSSLEQYGASLKPIYENSSHSHHQFSMIFTHPMMAINDTQKYEELAVPVHNIKKFSFTNQVIGDIYFNKETGQHSYKVLRAATELLPILVSIDCTHSVSPPIVVLFYLSLIAMEFAQQLTILMCCIDAIAQVNFYISSHPFRVGIIIFTIQVFVCLFLNSKVGFPVFEIIDASFSFASGYLALMAVLIFVVLRVQKIRLTFQNIVEPLLKNNDGYLFSVLEIYSSFFLPAEIGIMAIILFIDSERGYIQQNSNGAIMKKIIAGVFQCTLMIFVASFFIITVCRSSKKYGNLKESLVNTLTPQLTVFSTRREFLGRNSFETVHSIFGDETDDPPRYSPPPSYSLATSRHVTARTQRSHSAGEIRNQLVCANSEVTNRARVNNQYSMTCFSTNELQTDCETVANSCSLMETEV